MRIFLRKAAREFGYKYTQHRPFDSGQYCSVFENENKKRGQATFLATPWTPPFLERGREAECGGGGCASICLFEGLLPVNPGNQSKLKHKEK
jgi:hypothetical protein